MKTRTEMRTTYVAWDGKTFATEDECRDYEDEHSLDRLRCYHRERCHTARAEYLCHKRNPPVGGGKPYSRKWGRAHADALAKYRATLKEGRHDGEPLIAWLARIGAIADAVLKSRDFEKQAREDLSKQRKIIRASSDVLKQIASGTYKETFADFLLLNDFVPVGRRSDEYLE